MNVFAWKQYLDRGAEGQMTVLRHVLETTPLKPTLDFKMNVEDIRLIIYSNHVQECLL